MRRYYDTLPSPIGELLLVSTGDALCGLYMSPFNVRAGWIHDESSLRETKRQLTEYFAGERREFTIPLELSGTSFQKAVWSALLTVPFGATVSYGEIARRIDNPKAVRAVGLANNRNPISVIIPCHRVIGSDGSLTGYGGGLDRKRLLLDLERAVSLPSAA